MIESADKTYASYPSLYALGHAAIQNIFFDDVTIEEKIDGSQFSFGVFNGELQCRSKRCIITEGAVPDLFKAAVETAKRLHSEGKLTANVAYRGEAIARPKHNTLCYDRVPAGSIILFDIMVGPELYVSDYAIKKSTAEYLGLECVPLLFHGKLGSIDDLKSLLERVSILGGAKIEGFVVKNYLRFGHDKKPLFGKYVSEAFKEVHKGDWRAENPGKGDIVDRLVEKYRTPARWSKAVQHLRDDGKLTNSPKDIGPLIVEAQADIRKECEEEMKDILFKWAWKNVAHRLVGGLPQWYKDELLNSQPVAEESNGAA